MRTILVALLLVPGGCFLTQAASPFLQSSATEWIEVGPILKSSDDILAAIRDAFRRTGLKEAPGGGPSGMTSDWLVELSSKWRDGFRVMVETEILPLEPRGVKIRMREYREVNDNFNNPSRLEDAQWMPASIDERRRGKGGEYALRVMQIVKFRLVEN
jgi:hypothetical protein